MASNDIAAIEKASLDAIKSENLLPDSLPIGRELREGKHLFEKIFGKDPYSLIKILEEMEMGNGDYEFEEID
ncbi:MAG: 4Fe-4S ferredoxin, partial [Actinomycetia bacterium]|nr:4Fe-4S ferredoxin [Actinomycetes bacterium]